MQQGNASSPSRSAPHVLIVDDDPDIRDVIGLLLREDGFSTSLCATLQQAISTLQAHRAQLIITDRRLGGGDGLDLIRFTWGHAGAETRIILLTAARPAVSADEQDLVVEAGVHIIAKPFDIEHLLLEARALTGWPGQ